jgi:hypothetical protein
MGIRGKAFQGDSFYAAPNPPFGAVFTYYLGEELKTLEKQRQEAEKKVEEDGGTLEYPDWEELRAEDREEAPAIVLTVRDEDGNVVRRIEGPVTAGFHRVAWDLRYPSSDPVRLTAAELAPWSDAAAGPLAVPGSYTVSLAKRVQGELTDLAGPLTFETEPLGAAKLAAEDRAALLAFLQKVARLQRAVQGAVRAAGEAETRIEHLKVAVLDTPAASVEHHDRLRAIEGRLADLKTELTGDRTVASRNEPVPPSISGRVNRIVYSQWASTSAPTGTNRDAYRHAGEAFEGVLQDLTTLIETDLAGLEAELEQAGAPWTPGRVPRWEME